MSGERKVYVADNGQLKQLVKQNPKLKPGEVVVTPKAFAYNPTDWKHVDHKWAEGSVIGCDFSGVVSAISPDVTSVKVGDTVSGGVTGGNEDNVDDGAFATAINVPADSLFFFPEPLVESGEKSIACGYPATFEQAAQLGVALSTTILEFEHDLGIKLEPNTQNGYAVINGAASSLGFQVAQVAKYVGFDVIVTASPHHKKLFESVGITNVIDYHDPDWVSQVRSIGGDNLIYGFDAIGTKKTLKDTYDCVTTSKPAHVGCSLPVTRSLKETHPNVKVHVVMYYMLWQQDKKFGPNMILDGLPKAREERAQYFKRANKLLQQKILKVLPTRVVGSGLESVPDALNICRRGVSGYKISTKL